MNIGRIIVIRHGDYDYHTKSLKTHVGEGIRKLPFADTIERESTALVSSPVVWAYNYALAFGEVFGLPLCTTNMLLVSCTEFCPEPRNAIVDIFAENDNLHTLVLVTHLEMVEQLPPAIAQFLKWNDIEQFSKYHALDRGWACVMDCANQTFEIVCPQL